MRLQLYDNIQPAEISRPAPLAMLHIDSLFTIFLRMTFFIIDNSRDQRIDWIYHSHIV